MNGINTAGLHIGHATDVHHHTGCTVFLCPPGAVVSADVRGPAPGSRESALLQPDKPTSDINAILLTGGSAFGLSAADGVMRYLAERGIGHTTPIRPVPLVAAAVVYDLFFSRGQAFPNPEMGYAACLDARPNNAAQGNIGAGAGVTVGKWNSFPGPMKGGLGLASAQEGELVVMAAAVVNAVGDVVNADGSVLAGAELPDGRWAVSDNPYRLFRGRRPENLFLDNTTLVVVAANARLSKVEAYRLAQRAHDGLAMAIRPIHTTHDGDTAFALGTGRVEADFDWVANMGAELTAVAIRNAVRHAHSLPNVRGLAGPPTLALT